MDQVPTAWQTVSLANRLSWARRHMRLTADAAHALPRMDDVRLACTIHVNLKALLVLLSFIERGASVAVLPADPATSRPDVGAHLASVGADIDALAITDRVLAARHCVEWAPTHTLEMGADIAVAAAGSGYNGIRCGLEVTRTGLARLAKVAPRHPVFDVDSVPLKAHLHNRYAVGTSTWHTFMARTQLSLHGLVVVVVGYGEVGTGLAHVARSLGARVIVAERDSARQILATYDGFESGDLLDVAPRAQVVVTATGRTGVVSGQVLERLPDGAFVVNAGHDRNEVDVAALGRGEPVLPHVERHAIGSAHVFLFASGHIANLAAGDGDSLNTFDVTAAVMVRALGWAVQHGAAYLPGVHPLPVEAWDVLDHLS